jgi:uncharacterized protein YlxW (UPF0749 family)
MTWLLGLLGLVILVALMIPILSIVLDSPFAHRMAESQQRALGQGPAAELDKRVGELEDDVQDLGEAVRVLKDETQFLQRLLERGESESQQKLQPPT